MSWRVPPQLKEAMDQAAAESGRSVAQEIELRLDRSFRTESLLNEVLDLSFGQENANYLYVLGVAMLSANYIARGYNDGVEQHWRDNASTFKAVENTIGKMFDKLRPPGKPNAQETERAENLIKMDIPRSMTTTEVGRKFEERLKKSPNAVLFLLDDGGGGKGEEK
jgi:hypothetical protein